MVRSIFHSRAAVLFGALAFALYCAVIVGANWLVAVGHPDPIPVGFGLLAPSGVLLAGLAFSFRNLTQQSLGRRFGFAAIAIGTLISATFFSANVKLTESSVLPLAIASGVSFFLSETVDAFFWTWLRENKGWWTRAMAVGDLAGQAVDSAIFLFLAFGAPSVLLFLGGQILGKSYTVYPAMGALYLLKRYKPRLLNLHVHHPTFRVVNLRRAQGTS
jgi:queuosine precursor transporter